jgi:hypothetical protein
MDEKVQVTQRREDFFYHERHENTRKSRCSKIYIAINVSSIASSAKEAINQKVMEQCKSAFFGFANKLQQFKIPKQV